MVTMTECLPWWLGPVALLLCFVMHAWGYHQGKKDAVDEWLMKTTLDYMAFKAKLGEKYMNEKDRERRSESDAGSVQSDEGRD